MRYQQSQSCYQQSRLHPSHRRPARYPTWLIGAALGLLIAPLRAAPLQAHKVELDGTIGATLHIEPNDTPRAGEAALTWFALTKRGGESVPLADCDCQLAVFGQSESEPVLEPELEPINAEGYQDIPGAEIAFPQVGAYELVLTGAPASGEGFEAFELRFPVTVAAGQAVSDEPAPDELAAAPTQAAETAANQSDPSDPSDQSDQTEVADGDMGGRPVRSHTLLTVVIVVLAAAAGVTLAIRRQK